MIIATGGQGEPRAALARIAFGQHQLALDAGDLVIFSSKQIPGNEIAIGRIQNELAAQGHRDDHRPPGAGPRLRPSRPPRARGDVRLDPAGDHRAGPWRDAPHVGAGALRPRPRHPARHRPEEWRPRSASRPNGPKSSAEERVGRLILDGDVILPAEGSTMNERRRAAMFGLIAVAVALDERRPAPGRGRDRPSGRAGRGGPRGLPRRGPRRRRRRGRARTAASEDKLREAVRLAVRRCAHRMDRQEAAWSACLIVRV